MKKITRFSALIALSAIMQFSCTKKDPPVDTVGPDPAGKTSSVKMEFFNKVGSANLSLNNAWYVNEHGDSFNVNMFKYYISGIELKGSNIAYKETSGVNESKSYHLIVAGVDSTSTFDLKDVPYGVYSSITLMIGVDSLRNVSGAQTGALDPVNDMFWTWSTGYIMLKLEGKSTKSPAPDSAIRFHAGGFSGQYATQRTVTLNFPTPITVGASGINHLHLTADVLKLFKSPTVVDFSTTYSVSSIGKDAKYLADNYANMLTVTAAGL